jgi:hypothetical protein
MDPYSTDTRAPHGRCDKGHPFTREASGENRCRVCKAEWGRARYVERVKREKGDAPYTQDPRAMVCQRIGHVLEGENKVILPSGRWRCMECYWTTKKWREAVKAKKASS